MKKLIYILLIILIYSQSFAQNRLTLGEIKGKHEIFIVKQLKSIPNDTQKRIIVVSKSNKYDRGVVPPPKNPYAIMYNQKTDVHVNDDALREIVYSVLKNKLDVLKQAKETMNVICVFELNGILSNITVSLNANTLITVQEIEEIDKQLRANIKATFTGKQYSQFQAIHYYIPTIKF